MFDKVIYFLLSLAINGFIAIFIATFFYIILVLIFTFAMTPVFIVAGGDIGKQIIDFVVNDFGYKIVYIVVFTSMMMDDLGIIPKIKTVIKKWREK